MTRGTISLIVFAIFLVTGCGSQTWTAETTLAGNKVSVAGVTVEVRPGGQDIRTSHRVDEAGEYQVRCGDTLVEIAGMRLFVSTGPKYLDKTLYGSIAKGDSILIDDGAVFVNGEKRTASNE